MGGCLDDSINDDKDWFDDYVVLLIEEIGCGGGNEVVKDVFDVIKCKDSVNGCVLYFSVEKCMERIYGIYRWYDGFIKVVVIVIYWWLVCVE